MWFYQTLTTDPTTIVAIKSRDRIISQVSHFLQVGTQVVQKKKVENLFGPKMPAMSKLTTGAVKDSQELNRTGYQNEDFYGNLTGA
jgi:hypothetical protein